MKGETNMSGTIWALVPPIVAIALALWTKEVYLSLLIGILSGALLFTKFHILAATQTMIEVMNWKIGDNVNILLFLVFLGIIVAHHLRDRHHRHPDHRLAQTTLYGSLHARPRLYRNGSRSLLCLQTYFSPICQY